MQLPGFNVCDLQPFFSLTDIYSVALGQKLDHVQSCYSRSAHCFFCFGDYLGNQNSCRIATAAEWLLHPCLPWDHFLIVHKRYVQIRLIYCLKYGSLLIPCQYALDLIFSYNLSSWVSLSSSVFLVLLWLLLCLIDVHLIHNMLSGSVFRVTLTEKVECF